MINLSELCMAQLLCFPNLIAHIIPNARLGGHFSLFIITLCFFLVFSPSLLSSRYYLLLFHLFLSSSLSDLFI